MDVPLVDKSEEMGTFRTVLLRFIFFCTTRGDHRLIYSSMHQMLPASKASE
jgi:hypothetical protein